MTSVFAAADIGSNTAHLLVGATDGELLTRLDNVNEWIPLGEEVALFSEISKERTDQLCSVMKEFRKVGLANGAEVIYVFATEAMRSATNHTQVLQRIKKESGIQVDIIEPNREAELSAIGVRLDSSKFGANLMFEVGGGSAQIATLAEDAILSDVSVPLGTGRIIAEAGLASPAHEKAVQRAQDYISGHLGDLGPVGGGPGVICSGGVARGIWRALHPDGEKMISLIELDYLAWAASRLSISRIVERFNVKTKRAGTLLPGALVYAALLRKFECESMRISEFGVREGAILQMARGVIQGQRI